MIRSIAAGAAAAALLAAAAYEDGPPPGYTGGFGEPTCADCHFDGGTGAGEVRIEGLPDTYQPGASYTIRVVLAGAGAVRAGYQLAARSGSAGAQAGSLEPMDSRSRVTEHAGLQYVHHTLAGAAADASSDVEWAIRWTAPACPDVDVVFNVAANAADGDASQLGDRIHTREMRVRGR